MDWKIWKTVLHESYSSQNVKEIDFIKNAIEDTKDILDNLVSRKFVFFDLETAGLNKWNDQITQIAAIAVEMERAEGDVVKAKVTDQMDITIYLTDEMKNRLQPETRERKQWEIRSVNDALYYPSKKKGERVKIRSFEEIETLPEDYKEIAKNKLKDLDPEFALKLTGYNESNATATEKDALKQFMVFLQKHPGSILTGHNINSFDLPYVNERMKIYTEDPNKIKNIQDFRSVANTMDTVILSRNVFIPALKKMQTEFGEVLQLIDTRLGKQEIKESEPTEKELAAQNIMKVGDDYVQSFDDEEKKILAKYKYLFTILKTKVDQTLDSLQSASGKHSSRMGDIAKVFNINAEGWHNALSDILMLVDVYNAMRRTINLASKMSLSQLQEMEPYQRSMHEKHPRWKARLTRGGTVKDKSTPYKTKLSLKRGKSAPPGG